MLLPHIEWLRCIILDKRVIGHMQWLFEPLIDGRYMDFKAALAKYGFYQIEDLASSDPRPEVQEAARVLERAMVE